jgi:serine phosphatase RsbU (regulator of sigma subunit)
LEPDEVPLLRALRGETVRDVEMVVAPTGQPPRRLLASGQQLSAADGTVLGAVVVMHDVTVVHTAEALRLQQQAALTSLSQLQLLNGAAMAVNQASDVEGVLQAICEHAVAIVGAEQAVASLTRGLDWSQAIAAFVLSERYAAWRDYAAPPDGTGIYALVCETNRPVRLTQDEFLAHPRFRGFGSHLPDHPPMRGWLAAPLIGRDGSNLGLIQLTDKRGTGRDGAPAEFDETDEAMLVQLAQIASLSLEKMVQYEREHQVAVELQRSLLPQHLPSVPGFEVHAGYVPGRGELDLTVGGDWYDVFPLDDDHVALALGDVVGHGLRSASLMGQIRSALRGLAMHQSDPAIVVTALDRLVATLGDDAMATLAYSVLHMPTGQVRTVLAGHPAPLVRVEGAVRALAAEPGPPLGTQFGLPYAAANTVLPVGGTLLMFSDGLVEHRGRLIGAGLNLLGEQLRRAPAAPALLGPHLIDAMTGGANDDDVALLVVHRSAERLG